MSHLFSFVSELQSKIALTSTREAHELVDERIEQLHKTIVLLKSIRNEQSIVSKLPAEVLSTILCTAINPRSDLGNLHTLLKVSSWKSHVDLTAVCTHWRSVALGCPEYWCMIPFTQSKHYDKMIARSGNGPQILTLYTRSFGSSNEVPELLVARMNATNLAELHVALDEPRLSALSSHFPRTISPMLSRVVITATSSRAALLPLHKLFTCSLPVLRHLSLENCNIPWSDIQDRADCQFPKDLLSLHIAHPADPCPCTLLLSILESSPKLRHLHLEKVLNPDFIPSTEVLMPLDSLQTCYIQDGSAFVPFYASCAWPQALNVTAELNFHEPTPLNRFLTACHATALEEKFHTLRVTPLAGAAELRGPGLKCTITLRPSGGLRLIRDAHLPALTTLEIQSPDRLLENPQSMQAVSPESAMAQFLIRHEKIDTLVLGGDELCNVLDLLARQSSAANDITDSNLQISCPSLVNLTLEKTAMSEHDWDQQRSQPPQARNISQSLDAQRKSAQDAYRNFCSLQGMLRSRCEMGLPIKQLSIGGVEGFEKVVKLVEAITGEGVVQ